MEEVNTITVHKKAKHTWQEGRVSLKNIHINNNPSSLSTVWKQIKYTHEVKEKQGKKSPKADRGHEGEESKYLVVQLHRLFEEDMKKLGEFKEDMTQKYMELSLKISNVDLKETNKILEEPTKILQNINYKFTKDI